MTTNRGIQTQTSQRIGEAKKKILQCNVAKHVSVKIDPYVLYIIVVSHICEYVPKVIKLPLNPGLMWINAALFPFCLKAVKDNDCAYTMFLFFIDIFWYVYYWTILLILVRLYLHGSFNAWKISLL